MGHAVNTLVHRQAIPYAGPAHPTHSSHARPVGGTCTDGPAGPKETLHVKPSHARRER